MKTKKIRCAGRVAHLVEKMNAYKILMAKPEGKRPQVELGLEECDNNKVNLKDIG
jgi:hypothetical protein